MKRDLRFVLISFLFVLSLAICSLGQETTGSIFVTVTDAQGKVVPNASLTVSSTGDTTGFKRNVTTNEDGEARLIQVPPGVYFIVVAPIQGFVEKRVESVIVSL